MSKGAVKLKSGLQVDRYYNPRDRNLMESGELLRIREEADKRVLTYKGPNLEGDVRKRPSIEFDIDQETEDSFLKIYGDKLKTIIKERSTFELSGITLAIDKVWRQEKGLNTELGNFIEIRLPDKEQGIDSIRELLAHLGLNPSLSINQSYFEM
jgi:predicted adenylyl cyclase CyaB